MNESPVLTLKYFDKIHQLQEKFQASVQDMLSYLEGLLYADYLKRNWEYHHLDVLLSLQQQNKFQDEKIINHLHHCYILWTETTIGP